MKRFSSVLLTSVLAQTIAVNAMAQEKNVRNEINEIRAAIADLSARLDALENADNDDLESAESFRRPGTLFIDEVTRTTWIVDEGGYKRAIPNSTVLNRIFKSRGSLPRLLDPDSIPTAKRPFHRVDENAELVRSDISANNTKYLLEYGYLRPIKSTGDRVYKFKHPPKKISDAIINQLPHGDVIDLRGSLSTHPLWPN